MTSTYAEHMAEQYDIALSMAEYEEYSALSASVEPGWFVPMVMRIKANDKIVGGQFCFRKWSFLYRTMPKEDTLCPR